jgi:3-deoxy-manno-octulosonate cytidylyltransferase (CMP-KDO synthetase)
MKQVIVIPARMKGTRLPGKPLIKLDERPIVWHVWKRCAEVHPRNEIYIATEDKEIADFARDNAIQCIVTGKAESALDRIKLFSDVVEADAYINVQGDEPIVNIRDIESILAYSRKYPGRVVFGKAPASQEEFFDFSKAKVVCDRNGRLLYSSRAGIPVNKKGHFVSAERAIWIYALNKPALDAYYENRDKTSLDIIEDNEIIRFLEIGVDVWCTDVIGDSWAIDEPKDIEIVRSRMGLKNIRE